MVAKSYSRGWSIVFINNHWIYEDNHLPLNELRPCKRCGKPPTIDGYDACLGYIPYATSACCGHGCKQSFIIKELQC